MYASLNVLGGPLQQCSTDPMTGWFRDGCCNSDDHARGMPTICAQVTEVFLLFLKDAGNDLITPHPEMGFPGLKPGDQWCVCAQSWRRAHLSGKGCPVKSESTHAATLKVVPLEEMMMHSIAPEV